MKIAYIAGFTGHEFVKKYNNNIVPFHAATQKILVFSRAFLYAKHEVDIISTGVTSLHRKISAFEEKITVPEGIINVKYIKINPGKAQRVINSFRALLLFIKENKKRKYNCVVLYNGTERSMFIALVARLLKIKIVLEYEDAATVNRSDKGRTKLFVYKNIVFKIIVKLSDLIISVNHDLVRNINKKSIVIPGALDDDIIKKGEMLKKLSLNINPIRIVYTGGLTISKGPDLLIYAVDLLKEYNIELHLFGDGDMRNKIAELKNQSSLKDKIILHGYVNRAFMIETLFNADILVNPHRINLGEGLQGTVFPFKMIEYAATGVPILSSAVGRFSEEFDKYINYYEGESPQSLADGIRNMLESYQTCLSKSKALQTSVVKDFSIEGLSKTFFETINKKKYDN